MLARVTLTLSAFAAAAAVMALPAGASHAWGNYHWARTANPFTIQLGNNTSGLWTNMLGTASSDWTQSTVLNTTIVAGGTKPRACRPTSGRVEVCNASYGNNGWLGLAQIWVTGDHITQGIVKNNDYYFGNSSYQYNNTAEMQHVICQEIGHTFGLDHQSTDGSSQNSCMDYYHNTSDSDLKSTHPNQHDYDELAIIYAHLDSFTTVGASVAYGNPTGNAQRERDDLYVEDLGNGQKLFTWVFWTDRRAAYAPPFGG